MRVGFRLVSDAANVRHVELNDPATLDQLYATIRAVLLATPSTNNNNFVESQSIKVCFRGNVVPCDTTSVSQYGIRENDVVVVVAKKKLTSSTSSTVVPAAGSEISTTGGGEASRPAASSSVPAMLHTIITNTPPTNLLEYVLAHDLHTVHAQSTPLSTAVHTDSPLADATSTTAAGTTNEAAIIMLTEMGFSRGMAEQALFVCNGDLQSAGDYLASHVSGEVGDDDDDDEDDSDDEDGSEESGDIQDAVLDLHDALMQQRADNGETVEGGEEDDDDDDDDDVINLNISEDELALVEGITSIPGIDSARLLLLNRHSGNVQAAADQLASFLSTLYPALGPLIESNRMLWQSYIEKGLEGTFGFSIDANDNDDDRENDESEDEPAQS